MYIIHLKKLNVNLMKNLLQIKNILEYYELYFRDTNIKLNFLSMLRCFKIDFTTSLKIKSDEMVNLILIKTFLHRLYTNSILFLSVKK